MDSVFGELSLVIVVTVAVSIIMRLIKQPLILGYILAGLLVGPSVFGLIHSAELFEVFSEIGIALLLFIIGLGMHVGEFRRLGKVVLLTAMASLVSITTLGFVASKLLGFESIEAIVIGLALFFSSTIIIIKLLTDKKEQNRLHGQIAIGVILVEDVIATLALLFIAAGKEGGGFDPAQLYGLGSKLILLIGLLFFVARFVVPRVSKYIAGNQELLFLAAIAWGFGVATLFEKSGFSIEIGALFAGVALATSPFSQEISSRLRPLRDFFLVIFFIALGEQLDTNNLGSAILPAAIFSAIVILIKPIVVTAAAGLLGYTKRVSFKTGINLSQISEFSIILVVLAISEGIVRSEIGSIITIVAIVTIATSTYMITYIEPLYKFLERFLDIFEKRKTKHEGVTHQARYDLVLFGYQKGGHEFVKTFKQLGKPYVVIDYDPEMIMPLEHNNVHYIYGDASNVELLEEASIAQAKLIVSTISEFRVTEFLLQYIEEHNPNAAVICLTDRPEKAIELYKLGASYVMLPHYIGSEKLSSFIRRSGYKKKEFSRIRTEHLEYLEAQLDLLEKHEHHIERDLGQAILKKFTRPNSKD